MVLREVVPARAGVTVSAVYMVKIVYTDEARLHLKIVPDWWKAPGEYSKYNVWEFGFGVFDNMMVGGTGILDTPA